MLEKSLPFLILQLLPQPVADTGISLFFWAGRTAGGDEAGNKSQGKNLSG